MAGKREPLGGGIFIVIGIFAGIFIGRAYGQISAGLLIGMAAGVAVAGVLWLVQRRA